MRIGIMGAGAIGLLFGAYMYQVNHKIIFITRTKAQAKQLEANGCHVQLCSEERLHFYPQSLTIEEQAADFVLNDIELLVITVKQPSLSAVVQWLKKNVPAHVPFLCLMNGLGHEQIFIQHVANPVYYGITASGATRIESTFVVEKGRGITRIGSILESQSKKQEVHHKLGHLIMTLQENGLPIAYTDDIESVMWKKCVINACINPVTALFNVPNGQLIKNTDLHHLMYQLYSELVPLIEKVKGIKAEKILNNGRLWQEIEDVCRNTSENISSMLTDIKTKQKTEIEAMTGYFLRMAKTYNFDLPSHQFIYHALQFLYKRGEE